MPTSQDATRAQFSRGAVLRLDPHADHCGTNDALIRHCRSLRAKDPELLLAADLFAGAGGMSLGLEDAGMKVVFGADHDPDALETHAHHFGGMAVDWDLGDPERVHEVGTLLAAINVDVIAGGPPCQPFSKAGRSKMRALVRDGIREPHDQRRDLWRSYLEIVAIARPRVVIMENVPDMALDREMFILRSIVLSLEKLGYSVQERLVDTQDYGVPQFRQRIILVAIAGGAEFEWPDPVNRRVNLATAIADLPTIDPQDGWRPSGKYEGWRPYRGPITEFQREMRVGVERTDQGRIYDHVTRRVRSDDAEAFEYLDSDTRYSELPAHLKRYRDDIFDDKYKRLDAHKLSRTITAHIAKDGYWYIHPEQNRTLTIREAARIQTFPDRFRFAGSPTAALRQIGNAVPPRLAECVGEAVLAVLNDPAPGQAVPTSLTSQALARWFSSGGGSARPWLASGSRWLAVLGETLLGSCSPESIRSLWPLATERWATPEALLADQKAFLMTAGWVERSSESAALIEVAAASVRAGGLSEETIDELVAEKRLARWIADLALVVDSDGEEPVVTTTGSLRVAGRFFRGTGRWLTNQNSDGRIAVARLIGYEESSRSALLALSELGVTTCTPRSPRCTECPLNDWCTAARSG